MVIVAIPILVMFKLNFNPLGLMYIPDMNFLFVTSEIKVHVT